MWFLDFLNFPALQEPLEPIVSSVKPPPTPYAAPETAAPSAESVSAGKAYATLPPQVIITVEAETSKSREGEPVVSSKDLGSIKDAIESMEESKKALQEEHLLDLKVSISCAHFLNATTTTITVYILFRLTLKKLLSCANSSKRRRKRSKQRQNL